MQKFERMQHQTFLKFSVQLGKSDFDQVWKKDLFNIVMFRMYQLLVSMMLWSKESV